MKKMMMNTTMRRTENVIVVLEGVKASSRDEKGVAPLSWAMRNVVHTNGDLLVLNILNPTIADAGLSSVNNRQGFMSQREGYLKFLHEQIGQRRETYRQILRPFYDRCKISGVKFEAKVAAGFQPKKIVIEEAKNVRATWIVMDRSFVDDVNLQLHRKDLIIALVNDFEEAEVHNPPLSNGLEISTVRKEIPNPKYPNLLKDSLSQEMPHLRDSLPISVNKDVESGVHSPSLSNRLDVPIFTDENPKPNRPKLLKESLLNEEPHIRDSWPLLLPFMESTHCEKEIGMEPSSKETSECDNVCEKEIGMEPSLKRPSECDNVCEKEADMEPSINKASECYNVPTTSEHYNVAWRRNLEPTLVLKLPFELSWEEILAITDRFQACWCMSGHANLEMYKGRLRDPPGIEVMVKQYAGDCNSIIEAEKRVSSSLLHRNILVPISYHQNSYTSALVFPYTGNGTLNQYLSGNLAGLTSSERIKIAIGIGIGVRYMHEECPGGPIVHGDLRLDNIFLGCNYQPLISGFGQARWLKMEQFMIVENNNRCWPEAAFDNDSMLLIKSDVFAFGLLLLRLFCRQPMPENDVLLVDWARPLLLLGAFHKMLDQDMEDLDMYEMYRVMSAATQCIKSKPLSRPCMTQVLSILRGENSCFMQSSPSSEISLEQKPTNFF